MNCDRFIRGVHMTASRVMVSESLYFYETLDIKIPQHIFIQSDSIVLVKTLYLYRIEYSYDFEREKT